VLGLGLFVAADSSGQVKGPAAPPTFAATIRYRIRADRDGRIIQYREMEKNLAAAGYRPTDPEAGNLAQFDPSTESIEGTVPSASASKLLEDPRVMTVLLAPSGYKLQEDGSKPVQVRLTLSANLQLTEQRLLHEQSVARLALLGFRENVGYDHARFTQIRGAIPARVVPTLLKDLRRLPTGWFLPAIPTDHADLPFRAVLPIRIIEVLPDAPDTTAVLPPEPKPGKITADARFVMAVPGPAIRLDLVLAKPLDGSSKDLRDHLRFVAPTAMIEGISGNIVSVRVDTDKDVEAIAGIPDIRQIRAQRASAETSEPYSESTAPLADWLRQANVKALHNLGYRGAGSKVVVLGTEFPNLDAIRGRLLPQSTTRIDMTAEINPFGLPSPANARDAGAGLAAAVAAYATAPDATFVLIRLDPAAFHQLLTVARESTGETGLSEGLRSKVDRFTYENVKFIERRKSVMTEYTSAAEDVSDNPKSIKRRADALAAVKKLDAEQVAFQAAFARLTAMKKALDNLAGAAVIINTLAWDAGQANDGLNPLQPILEERFVPPVVSSAIHPGPTTLPPIWIQAASGAVGSVWSGPARDADGNGVMEFAAPGAKLPAGTWTPELNFLSLRAPGGKKTDILPAGAKVRFSLQWREPQDPDLSLFEPNIRFRLTLLKQIDPSGTKAATDELVEVAHTAAEPVRLYKALTSGVYELTLDATIPTEGRYVVRVEYGIPALKVIRARKVKAEIYPRLVVEAADVATAAKGRVMFSTFAPTDAGVGIPGDSQIALTVGCEEPGLALTGAGAGMDLRTKPDLLARGTIEVNGKRVAGPAVSAGYVGGIAAAVRGTGAASIAVLRQELTATRGRAIVLPKSWLETLQPK
jgi:hypothetical protein